MENIKIAAKLDDETFDKLVKYSWAINERDIAKVIKKLLDNNKEKDTKKKIEL